jgi:hypothetical protein
MLTKQVIAQSGNKEKGKSRLKILQEGAFVEFISQKTTRNRADGL